MGLGPLNAVYQARFNRYLYNREIVDTSNARVWCFVGDGEMDEPEAIAALSLAARERLDNLIFVVNCNLQRLDGPVRGNGKVIQEFESIFRGMGWNVIKVDLGQRVGRPARPRRRRRARQQDEHDASTASSRSTRSSRARTSGSTSSAPIRACARWSSTSPTTSCSELPRGGHDYRKLYAAYKTAVEHEGAPTVILAKTVKGWTLGADFEARNATHQIKKMTVDDLKAFRDRLYLEIPDAALETASSALLPPRLPTRRSTST